MPLNGQQFLVVGVAPRSFRGAVLGAPVDIWIPIMMQAQVLPGFDGIRSSGASWLYLMGRLKSGVKLESARARLEPVFARFQQLAGRGDEEHIVLRPGNQGPAMLGSELAAPLTLLTAAAATVLLIACANIASLLLARAADRRKELSIRLALGAARSRLVRMLMTESALLALAGGAVGLLLAYWTRDLLLGLVPIDRALATAVGIEIESRVLAFTLALSATTALLFGLAPALAASRQDLVPALKDEILALPSGNRRISARNALVVIQVALAMLLMVVAGLFVRTLAELRGQDIGLRSENVLLFSFELDERRSNAATVGSFCRQLIERLESLPGVVSATVAHVPPVNLGGSRMTMAIEGYEPRTDEDMELNFNAIGLRYFETLGIPLLRGRDFTEHDGPGAPGVAIVNETMARRFWKGHDPIGKRIRPSGSQRPGLVVIGVSKDTKYWSMRESDYSSFYLPLFQNPRYATSPYSLTVHVRTAANPAALIDVARREVQAIDRNIPIFDIRTLTEQIDAALARERLAGRLSGIFGILALLLAAVGLYGVLAHSVGRRTHEIGVRMALGAQPRDLVKLVIGKSMALVAAGTVLGLAGTAYATRLITSLLFGIEPIDPPTYGAAALLVCGVALAASYLPARHAASVDPAVALRIN